MPVISLNSSSPAKLVEQFAKSHSISKGESQVLSPSLSKACALNHQVINKNRN